MPDHLLSDQLLDNDLTSLILAEHGDVAVATMPVPSSSTPTVSVPLRLGIDVLAELHLAADQHGAGRDVLARQLIEAGLGQLRDDGDTAVRLGDVRTLLARLAHHNTPDVGTPDVGTPVIGRTGAPGETGEKRQEHPGTV